MFLMMRAVGEMLYQDPEQHTFINFITRHLGKGWGYFSVWSYWLSVVFIGMAEITAISHYVQFWFPSWPSWLIQIVFLTILALVNLIAVKLFGQDLRHRMVLQVWQISAINSLFSQMES